MRLLNRVSLENRQYPLRCLSSGSRGSSPPSAVAENNVISALTGVRRALAALNTQNSSLTGKARVFLRSLLFVKDNYLTYI